jgi:hypothetical protein
LERCADPHARTDKGEKPFRDTFPGRIDRKEQSTNQAIVVGKHGREHREHRGRGCRDAGLSQQGVGSEEKTLVLLLKFCC